jgi:glycerophosphoryl diester phosphodiesterase
MMWIVYSILALGLLLTALGLWCIKGRTGQPGLAELRRWKYAHRGLHDANKPENSMAAFRAALMGGYGIELDIHLMKDGNLAVIHDSSLKRVAGADVRIEDLSKADLQHYHLDGTGECIPLFPEVLDLFSGKAPLIVELKVVDNNHTALCEAACRLLDSYDGPYCIESFDPRVVAWLRKYRPDVIRGQLSENYFAPGRPKMPAILRFILTHHIENLVTRPDFIAYRFSDRACTPSNKRFQKRGLTVAWTLTNPEDYRQAVSEGWLPIFEGFLP